MKIIGIESTAHTFGVGIYDSEAGAVLANEKAYYKPAAGEGIIPRQAAEFHSENAQAVLKTALQKANLKMKDINAIAYSSGPGLGPCLQTGATVSSFLCQKYSIPLIPVNHCHAHIEVAKWQCKYSDPLILYVSGGNTQIIVGTIDKKTKKYGAPFSVLGETLDMGVGNLFDSFARELKMEFAHGGVVAQKAKLAKKFNLLPYTVKGMNFAFSGLFTYATKQIGKMDENDLCFSLMETAFCELCEASERALMLTNKKEIAVCGGVAQNSVLIEKVKMMAEAHGAVAGTCENQYNADNGAMIALTGWKLFEEGKKIDAKEVWSDQKYRIDMVK